MFLSTNGNQIYNDSGPVAVCPSADAARELARRYNAFDKLLTALERIDNPEVIELLRSLKSAA